MIFSWLIILVFKLNLCDFLFDKKNNNIEILMNSNIFLRFFFYKWLLFDFVFLFSDLVDWMVRFFYMFFKDCKFFFNIKIMVYNYIVLLMYFLCILMDWIVFKMIKNVCIFNNNVLKLKK